MSDDLVARLRSPEEIVFPVGTEMFIHSAALLPHTLFPVMLCDGSIKNLEPFSMQISTSDKLEAADEIERLRARVAELDDVLMRTLVSLVAAIDLLKAGGKAAAPSNKMFDQMIKDYEKAVSNARKQLAAKS